MKKAVHVYWFKSSSSDKAHETIRYNDGTLSCSCPGWCKRCSNGTRSCKHTRIVLSGVIGASSPAQLLAMGLMSHGPVGEKVATEAAEALAGCTLPKPQRRFNFE